MPDGTTVVYAGRIVERSYGEDDEAIFVTTGTDEELAASIRDDVCRDEVHPFARQFAQDLGRYGRYVSVAYYVTDEPKTADELLENEWRKMAGAADADYTQHYSDLTGYLWTDQELNVGGHNLLGELSSHVGRHLYMTVTFHREPL